MALALTTRWVPHLQWPQRRSARHNRWHLAGGQVHGTCSRCKRGQEVGYAEVRHQDVQGVQGINEEVGSPQVPVQDAQGVQVQQARHRLPQDGQDLGQGQAALGSSSTTRQSNGVKQQCEELEEEEGVDHAGAHATPINPRSPTSCLARSVK
jgi:hypothetical protein